VSSLWFCFRLLAWSGTESTVTEAIGWPVVPAMNDDDEHGAVDGMISKGNLSRHFVI
jgi:hypothetical protein